MDRSKFFRPTRQSQLKSLPGVCHRCGDPVARPSTDNALYVCGEHIGYLCGKEDCRDGIAKLENE